MSSETSLLGKRRSSLFKPRSRRLGGFLLCLRFIYLFFKTAPAVGWAVSCSVFGLLFFFFFEPRSRRLGGFLLCLWFILFFFKPRSRRLGGFLLCLRFILFFFKLRSRRLGGFLLCLRNFWNF